MQQHRIISLASILVMLLIPVIGWFLVAQPQIAAAATADQQRVKVDEQIQVSTALVAQLKADRAKLPDLNDELDELRGSIPAGIDPSGYIDGLDALAQLNGVVITDLTVSDAAAYSPAQGAAAAAPATDAATGDVPAAPADPAIVTNALIDFSNFVAIPVTISVTGDWAPILNFVHGLQSNDRLFLVTTLSTAKEQENTTTLIATVGGYIYAIPTGVEGHPRPTSTTVKQLTAPAPPVVETEEGTDTPTPAPTDTPAP